MQVKDFWRTPYRTISPTQVDAQSDGVATYQADCDDVGHASRRSCQPLSCASASSLWAAAQFYPRGQGPQARAVTRGHDPLHEDSYGLYVGDPRERWGVSARVPYDRPGPRPLGGGEGPSGLPHERRVGALHHAALSGVGFHWGIVWARGYRGPSLRKILG